MGALRIGIAALFLGTLAGPALADAVRCADAKGEATVDFDINFTNDDHTTGEVTRLDAAFKDFTVSTKPTDPDQKADNLAGQDVADNRLELYMTDPDDVRIVLGLRLFRDFKYDGTDTEYDEHVVAGTLRAMAAGVWAVTCTGW